jgi:AcrR family transcriptional regulator
MIGRGAMAGVSRTKARAGQARRAQATRAQVVAAAAELFVAEGYLQTTMADIAARAGVAVRTVYGVGSKVEVLATALDIAIVGDDEPVPVLERGWYRDLVAEPDGATALAVFTTAASRIIERVYPLYAVTRDAAADPEVAELLHRNKRQRFLTHAHVAGELATKIGFDPTLTADRAAQVIYTLMSQETYGLLVLERGWNVTVWAGWVHHHLRLELFPTAPTVAGRVPATESGHMVSSSGCSSGESSTRRDR